MMLTTVSDLTASLSTGSSDGEKMVHRAVGTREKCRSQQKKRDRQKRLERAGLSQEDGQSLNALPGGG